MLKNTDFVIHVEDKMTLVLLLKPYVPTHYHPHTQHYQTRTQHYHTHTST